VKKKEVKNTEGVNPMIKQMLFIPSNDWSELLTIANYPFGERRFDGKVWKVIRYLLELHAEKEKKKNSQYEDRLKSVEDRISELENEVYNKRSHEKVRTWAD